MTSKGLQLTSAERQRVRGLIVLVSIAGAGCERRADIRPDRSDAHGQDAGGAQFECDQPTASAGVFVLATFSWFRGYYGAASLVPQGIPGFEPRAEFNQYWNLATWRLALQVRPGSSATIRQRLGMGEVWTWAATREGDVRVYLTRDGEGRPFRTLEKPETVTFSEQDTCCRVENLLVAVHWSKPVRGHCASGQLVVEGPADEQ